MPEDEKWKMHGTFLVFHEDLGSIGHGATLPGDLVFVKWIGEGNVEGFQGWTYFKDKLDGRFPGSYWIQWEGE